MIAMIEKNKCKWEYGVAFVSFSADISNTFDQMPPDLIIIKLDANGFYIDALKLVRNHLPNKRNGL